MISQRRKRSRKIIGRFTTDRILIIWASNLNIQRILCSHIKTKFCKQGQIPIWDSIIYHLIIIISIAKVSRILDQVHRLRLGYLLRGSRLNCRQKVLRVFIISTLKKVVFHRNLESHQIKLDKMIRIIYLSIGNRQFPRGMPLQPREIVFNNTLDKIGI